MMNAESKQVLDAARELAPVVSSRAVDIESGRRLPLELLGQLKQAGFFRMFVPRSHGGLEVDLRTGMQILETLARADGATGWTTMIGAESPHLFSFLSRERFDAIYSGGPDVIMAGGFNAQGQAALPRRDVHTFRQHAAAAEGWFGQAGAALLGQPTGFWT